MMFTDWAWRAFVREFRKPEGKSLLALAYISDLRARGAMGTEGWWKASDVAQITGLDGHTTTVHLTRLQARGLVEQQPSKAPGKPHYWRMAEAARRQRPYAARTQAS
jgi:DNA-binding MarR family transcriptional regulator